MDGVRVAASALHSLATDAVRTADDLDVLVGATREVWQGRAAAQAAQDVTRHAAGVRAVATALLVVVDELARCDRALDALAAPTSDLLALLVAPVPTLLWNAHERAGRVSAAEDAVRLCGAAVAVAAERCDAVAAAARAAAAGVATGSSATSWSAALDRTDRERLADRLASWRGAAVATANRSEVAAHDVDLRVASALRQVRRDPVTGRPVPVLLLGYDPAAWSGRGRVEIAFGDPASAQDVAYVVPGLGTRADPDLDGLDEEAWSLYCAARASGSGASRRARPAAARTTATVAWLGYRTPDLAEVAFAHDAVVGARTLAAEIAALRRSRGEVQPHVTVVGHSYGSLVAGLTTRRRAGDVDDLVAVGSPGTSVDHAADLGVPTGHVWVGAVGADEVSHLSRFGTDPASAAFGAHRFPAEPSVAGTEGAHSGYLAAGSDSLAAVALVVAGRGAQVPYAPGRTDHGFAGALLPVLLPPLVALPLAPWLVRLPPTFDDPAARTPP